MTFPVHSWPRQMYAATIGDPARTVTLPDQDPVPVPQQPSQPSTPAPQQPSVPSPQPQQPVPA